jgi:RimJ/RimL family protein N-acetyltransferase
MITVREVVPNDAPKLVKLHKQLDEETKFMLFEPGEREINEDKQKNTICSFLESENSNIFIAESQGQLVGHLTVIGGHAKRIKHRAHLVIGILNDFTGEGIGQELFQVMEKWREETNINRLELTVMRHNDYGIRLYKKVGFEIEGIKKGSIKVDGKYVDEYFMAKIY